MAIKYKQRIPPFSPERLESIAKVLGDTTDGLTGSEINHILAQCNIGNPDSDITKWKRLYNALAEFQNEHKVG